MLRLLKTRITLVSALSIILVAATLFTAGMLTREEAESRYQNEAFNGKRILWQQIVASQLDGMRAELFSITRNQKAMTALGNGSKPDLATSLQPTFNRLEASKVIDGMQILSKDGEIMFIRPEGAGRVSDGGVASEAIKSGKISTGIEADVNGKLKLVFALPLYSSPGNVVGVGIYTRSLQALLNDFKRSEGSDIYIASQSGKLLHATDEALYGAINPQPPGLGERSYATRPVKDQVFAVLTQPMVGANGKPLAHLVSVSEYTQSYTKQNDILLYSVIAATGIFLLILLTLNWYIHRALKPLDDVRDTLDAVADGDFTKQIEVRSNDEIGQMLTALKSTVERLRHTITEVTGSTSTITDSSRELLNITAATSEGVDQQQHQIDQVATAMNEMTTTVQEVARHAQEAANSAHEADTEANHGRQVVGETIDSINSLAGEIENAAKVIRNVETDSVQIGTVLDVIKNIAEQTNLLALNAAIEAARAGEQGRGFAVVADEVRTLASRTQASTQEIHEMIEKLQSNSQQAVEAMTQSQEKAASTVQRATTAGESLDAITHRVSAINQMNVQIATAAEEQSAVAEDINQSIVRISQVAEQTAGGARQTSSASHELSSLAQDLNRLISQFRV